MTRIALFSFCVWLGCVSLADASIQLPISGYDIGDAVLSGHGNWAHTYDGTITPGFIFTNNSFPGTQATYSGVGNGTLTDGVIGSTESTTQLFVPAPGATDGTPLDPFITFTLPLAYTVDQIDIYGGDIPGNGIPGAITEVVVELLLTDFTTVSETFSTTGFGTVMSALGVPVNDRIDLTGSSLEGLGAYAVTLYGFVTPGAGGGISGTEGGWFSITEVEMFGDLAPIPPGNVPEFESAVIWGLISLLCCVFGARRFGRSDQPQEVVLA